MTTIIEEIIRDGGYSIEDEFIKPSEWTRPQIRISPKGGILHWTGNIGSGANAMANRNFFNNRAGTYGSAHVIGDDSRIVAALPYLPNDAEMAYHVGGSLYYTNHFGSYPNNSTIGYEMCVNADGDFRESYKRAVWTMAYWCYLYGWNPHEDVMMHWHITHKHCSLPMLDLILDDTFCKGVGFTSGQIQWMRDTLHIDGIQGNALWEKYLFDVTELTEIMNNGGIEMIQELLDKINALETKVVELESQKSMPIPDWALEAINSVTNKVDANGNPVMDSPDGRSYDLYAILTILHRANVI